MAEKTLRKSILLTVLEEEVSVDVDFRLLELLERVFDAGSVDRVVPLLVDPTSVPRSKVADVIADLLMRKASNKLTRSEIREDVITSDLPTVYSGNVAALFAAACYALKQVGSDEFDKINAGAQALKKKAVTPSPKDSSGPATP